jgi:hypothetical protein
MAIAEGWAERVIAGADGRVHEVTLSDAFHTENRTTIEIWKRQDSDRRAPEDPGAAATTVDLYAELNIDNLPSDAFRDAIVSSRPAREGQPEFRGAILEAYGSRCALTDVSIEEVLEAAHIIPYALCGQYGGHPSNGLLLRADLHALFDTQLLGFRPTNGKIIVEVADAIRDTCRPAC